MCALCFLYRHTQALLSGPCTEADMSLPDRWLPVLFVVTQLSLEGLDGTFQSDLEHAFVVQSQNNLLCKSLVFTSFCLCKKLEWFVKLCKQKFWQDFQYKMHCSQSSAQFLDLEAMICVKKFLENHIAETDLGTLMAARRAFPYTDLQKEPLWCSFFLRKNLFFVFINKINYAGSYSTVKEALGTSAYRCCGGS